MIIVIISLWEKILIWLLFACVYSDTEILLLKCHWQVTMWHVTQQIMSAMKLIEDSPVAQSFFIRLMIKPCGKLMRLLPDGKVSHPCHYLQHLLHPFKASLSCHSLICLAFDHPFDVYKYSILIGQCDIYDTDLIQTIILSSRHHTLLYANKYPKLPLLVSYMSPRASINSVHRIIVETDINRPSQELTFPHYIDCPPNQSAKIPFPRYIPVFEYFSRNIPGCFVMKSEGFSKGDVVRLGGSKMWEAVVEGVGQLGRDFISYDIREVGCLPFESQLTTQLIAPLLSCHPFYLQLLIMVYITLFSCLIQSLAVFGEDPQDSCTGTEGYTGTLVVAECGGIWGYVDWFP